MISNIRINFRYEVVDIILKKLKIPADSRFVIIEKIGNARRGPKKCFVCCKKPTVYSGFNTMDFFLESYTIVGLSCDCGDFYKRYEFGFLNLTAGNYLQFKTFIGLKLEQALIDDWNRGGYREHKYEKIHKQLSINPGFYDANEN